jgi:hypothetical protein
MSETPMQRAFDAASWLRQRADEHIAAGLSIAAAGPMHRPERTEALFLQATECLRAAHAIEIHGDDHDGV